VKALLQITPPLHHSSSASSLQKTATSVPLFDILAAHTHYEFLLPLGLFNPPCQLVALQRELLQIAFAAVYNQLAALLLLVSIVDFPLILQY